LPPPIAFLPRLLLNQTSSVTIPLPSLSFAPEVVAIRATKVTAVLADILAQKGYYHGGLNE
jgi:hypothetical protein